MEVKFYAARNGRACNHTDYRIEWVNTPMTRRIYKRITDRMRFELETEPEADQVIALVYTGVINTVTLSLNRTGKLTLITYHPGIMNAVMSVMQIQRGGDLHA